VKDPNYPPDLTRVGTSVRDIAGLRLDALPPSPVTLSAASELPHVGLNEALELCPLLRDKAPARFPRAALRWHAGLCHEVDLSLEEAQAVLAALVLLTGERKTNAAFALAELLSRRRLERPCKTLVAWAREA
jgi:hypothetical protein